MNRIISRCLPSSSLSSICRDKSNQAGARRECFSVSVVVITVGAQRGESSVGLSDRRGVYCLRGTGACASERTSKVWINVEEERERPRGLGLQKQRQECDDGEETVLSGK